MLVSRLQEENRSTRATNFNPRKFQIICTCILEVSLRKDQVDLCQTWYKGKDMFWSFV